MRVNGQSVKKPWQITAEEVTQIWAEAVAVYKGGEKLFLEGNVAAMEASEQAEAMETDDREGPVSYTHLAGRGTAGRSGGCHF